MNDVFLNIDEQPEESISIISERLEVRSQTGQFASFRNEYFSLMNLNNNASILELGGGTGVIGRAYIKETNFNGKYVVSDLSEQLLKFGKELAIKNKVDHLLDFKMIDAMASKTNNELFYDAVIMHTLVSHVPEPKIVLNNAKEYLKKGGIIVIFDADYETLLISSGDKNLDKIVNSAIKKGCVAQPKVMRKIPKIAMDLNLKLINSNSNLLFEAGNSEFFISMGKALSSAVVKANQLEKKIADNWIKKLENSIIENVFFGMCPFITYIYEV